MRLGAVVAAVVLSALPTPPAHADRADEVRTRSFLLLNEGVSAWKRGEYVLAVDRLTRASSMALNSFRSYYYLGRALNSDRRYDEAVEPLLVALDLDPGHLQAHISLGDAWLGQGDIDEARAAFYRAIKLRTEYAPALDGIARTYEAQADDKQAISYYQRAIASDPGFASPYTHLGDLYLKQGDVEEAIRLMTEAVTIRPDFGAGLNRLALAYKSIGLWNEAVATVNRAIEIEPGAASHRATLGQIQINLGLLTSAEISLGQAVDIDPALPQAREGLAEVARRRGEYESAVLHLDAILADDRTDTPTRNRVTERKEELLKEKDDLERLELILALEHITREDLRTLARICAGRGEWKLAADVFALTEPTEELEREWLAYMLLESGRLQEAHELYRALAEETGRAELFANSGVALARMGDDAAAADAFRRALEIDPKRLRARVYLGNALLRLGRADEAAEEYRAFLDEFNHGETAERVRRILAKIEPDPVGDTP